jgi:hypothetical protein
VSLNDSIITLNLPYTYNLDQSATIEQKNTRKVIGMNSAKIIEKMRDNLYEEVSQAILRQRGIKIIEKGDTKIKET